MDWVEIVIKFVIPLLAIIVTTYVLPILKEKNLYSCVKILVYAAEQIYGSNAGKEKFEYVKNLIKDKFKLSDNDLKNIIEAIVFEMNKTVIGKVEKMEIIEKAK